MTCPHCNHTLESESTKFCPECGTRVEALLPPMVCPSCAKVVKSDTAKFCPECGLEFSALPPLAPQNHATSQNTYPAYAVNMGIAAGKKPVDKMAYGLLAIFLGGLGIHKFIAGKAIGILYLLFCWTFIPAIIGLIEGIMAFTQQADEQGNIYV